MFYKYKKGFTLVEISLVLGISSIIGFMAFSQMLKNTEYSQAEFAGQQIKLIGNATDAYISNHYNTLSTLSNSTGESTDLGERTCDSSNNTCSITTKTLVDEGLLPSTFSGKNIYGSTYNIILKRSGTTPYYKIYGMIMTANPLKIGDNIRYDLLGKSMQAAGIDSGMTRDSSSEVSGFNGSWTASSNDYSNINKNGLLAYQTGYGTYNYSVFLRRDGTLPMTGNLDMGNQDIVNANNITASGLLTAGSAYISNNANIDGDENLKGKLTIAQGTTGYITQSASNDYTSQEIHARLNNSYTMSASNNSMSISGSKNSFILNSDGTNYLYMQNTPILLDSINLSNYSSGNNLIMNTTSDNWYSNIITLNRGPSNSSYPRNYSNLITLAGGNNGNSSGDAYNSIITFRDYADLSNGIIMNGNGKGSNYLKMTGDSIYGNQIILSGNSDLSDNYSSYGSGNYSNNISIGGYQRANQYDSRTPYFVEGINNIGNNSNNLNIWGGTGTNSGNININSKGDSSGNIILNSSGKNSGMIQASGNITSSGTVSGQYLLSNSIDSIGETCSLNGNISKQTDGTPIYCINGYWSNIPIDKTNSNGGMLLPNGLKIMWGKLTGDTLSSMYDSKTGIYETETISYTPSFTTNGQTYTFSNIINVQYTVNDVGGVGQQEQMWGSAVGDTLRYQMATKNITTMTGFFYAIGY